jgi:NAD(P)-dependent dehydrogenase (short-subunit alcohol dehydrogenase family)
MSTVLIIGASRGLGLEFVRQYRLDGWHVIATHRRAGDAKKLQALGATAIKLDTTSATSIAAFTEALGRKSIDVAIYNAGVYGSRANPSEPPARKGFDEVMHANVWGAMQLIPVVAPRLAKSTGKFAFVSSIMGSVSMMQNTGGMTYRASKAALNSVVKCASIFYADKGITCFVMHPGWVQTDMGGKEADITPEVSIAGMRKVIAKANLKSNGGFFNYTGETLAW